MKEVGASPKRVCRGWVGGLLPQRVASGGEQLRHMLTPEPTRFWVACQERARPQGPAACVLPCGSSGPAVPAAGLSHRGALGSSQHPPHSRRAHGRGSTFLFTVLPDPRTDRGRMVPLPMLRFSLLCHVTDPVVRNSSGLRHGWPVSAPSCLGPQLGRHTLVG